MKIKTKDIDEHIHGVLELFISELIGIMSKNGEDSNPMDVCIELRKCIDSWVKVNDLHPEDVKHFKTREELVEYMRK